MTGTHGDFVWYELMTSNAEAAQAFYGPLLGWSFADSGQEGVDYRMFSAGETQIGGILQLSEEMTEGGARPAWLGYVRVDDVPAAVDKVRKTGGGVMIEGHEVPGVGPFALLSDPQGAPFYVIDDRSGEDSGAFAKHEPKVGHCAWNELVTEDPSAADSFYRDLFGWEKGEAMDMGPMGLYQMYTQSDYGLGAIMKRPEEMPVSAWAHYFRVPEIDAAHSFVTGHGGQVLNGPMEIPGGDYILQGIDPQGAFFSIIGAKES